MQHAETLLSHIAELVAERDRLQAKLAVAHALQESARKMQPELLELSALIQEEMAVAPETRILPAAAQLLRDFRDEILRLRDANGEQKSLAGLANGKHSTAH